MPVISSSESVDSPILSLGPTVLTPAGPGTDSRSPGGGPGGPSLEAVGHGSHGAHWHWQPEVGEEIVAVMVTELP